MKKKKLIIWDMDGTLIRSSSAVPDSFIDTAREFGHSRYSRKEIVALYSLGVPENMLKAMLGKEPNKAVMEYFYETLESHCDALEVYAGIPECLGSNEAKHAVFTGASQRSAEILLNAVGLRAKFQLVLGGDNVPPKPCPDGLKNVAREIGVHAQECIYVGDAPTDIEAAKSASMSAVAAGWGHLYNDNIKADLIARSPDEVISYFECFG